MSSLRTHVLFTLLNDFMSRDLSLRPLLQNGTAGNIWSNLNLLQLCY